MNIGQIYHTLSIICYVASALAFILVIFLFFHYRILEAFNVLSGRKLKKDMERLSHLSGEASEEGDGEFFSQSGSGKKAALGTDELLAGMPPRKQTGKYDTETWMLTGSSDTEELYETEDGSAGSYSDTESLDMVLTTASDTELL